MTERSGGMSEDGPTLLIVDDNEDNRFTLTRRLKREGYVRSWLQAAVRATSLVRPFYP